MLVGYATGAFKECREDWESVIPAAFALSDQAIELNVRYQARLDNLSAYLLAYPQALADFDYLAAHAPEISENWPRTISQLAALPVSTILFHADCLPDINLLEEMKDRLAIENMDHNKTFGQSVKDMQQVLDNLPEARVVIDIAHAHYIDPQDKLLLQLIECFAGHIAHFHLSKIDYLGDHYPLRVSWPILIAEFALAALLWSAFIGLLFLVGLGSASDETSGFSFIGWWTQALFLTLGFPSSSVLPSVIAPSGAAANLLGAAGGVVLPALFTAAVVLKLFVSPDLLVFRPKVSLSNWSKGRKGQTPKSAHLAVRCYISTKFRVLDISFSAVLRYEIRSEDGALVLRHSDLDITNPRFPIAPQHIPITVMLPLEAGDLSGNGDDQKLRRIQGLDLGERALLVLVVTGTIPELGSEFTETYDFVLPDAFTQRPYASIDYDDQSDVWTGWEQFDE